MTTGGDAPRLTDEWEPLWIKSIRERDDALGQVMRERDEALAEVERLREWLMIVEEEAERLREWLMISVSEANDARAERAKAEAAIARVEALCVSQYALTTGFLKPADVRAALRDDA